MEVWTSPVEQAAARLMPKCARCGGPKPPGRARICEKCAKEGARAKTKAKAKDPLIPAHPNSVYARMPVADRAAFARWLKQE